MGSDNSPRKRSRLSPANIDASVELNLAPSSKPRKSPRLMEQAQSQDLMQAQNEKANRKHDSYFGLRRSPRLIDHAQRQQLEHSEDSRKGKQAEHRIYERIRNTFMSENDRVSKLEQRRIRDREKRSALTEDEIERNRERCRNAYLKRRQKKVEGEINQRTSATGASTSTSSTSQIDRANKQFAVRTDVGELDHSGKESISSQDNAINSGNTIFIPRRSPRIAGQVQGQEHLDDIEKERGKKPCHESVNSDNESQETKRREMHRTAKTARRSSLTEKKREQILENRRSTYQMKRKTVGDATNNEGRARTSSGMESDRGKRVRNDQEAGPSRVGIEGNMPTRFSHLRRSPRFLNQDRMDEPRPSTNRATLEEICNQHRTRSSQHRHENKEGHAGGTSCDNERNVVIGTDSGRDKKRPLEMDKILEHHVKDRGKRVRNDQGAGPSRAVPRRSPRFIGQVQLRDEEATEASRKKKGKSVVVYQRRRRANVSYVPDGNIVGGIVIGSTRENNNHELTDDSSSDDGETYDIYEQDNAEAIAKNVVSELRPSTIGALTSTTSTSRDIFRRATQLPLRRSPRFSQQPQHGEPSHTQNAIVTNDNLRRSPRFMGQAQSQQSQHAQNATSNPQGVQVGRGRGRPLLSVAGRSSFLNCARGITYKVGFQKFHLPPSGTCPKCQAMIFYREPKGFCCSDGKVFLPFVAPPIELLELYDDQTEVGVHFRRYIRRYNQCFSLTSIGVNYDRELADNREGVYTFRVQGDIYHRIGSLLPHVVENETDPPRTLRPRYVQMYIYDTDNEINWRMEEGGDDLNREVMEKLRIILDTHNRFVHVIRPLAQREDIQRCRLVIKEQPATEKQYTLPTASQVAAIVVEGDGSEKPGERDIVVRTTEGKLLFINETSGCYDPLQYPLLLPYGSYGWDLNSMDENSRQFTCLEYYSYMLQIRRNDTSLLLRGGRLLQQYAVDNWVKIDSSRLRWLSNHQEEIRAELHQGLQDARMAGETSAKDLGQRKVLPSSYMGSPRDMYQRYQDAMALVQKYGKPDLFITTSITRTRDAPAVHFMQPPGVPSSHGAVHYSY